MNQFNIQQQPQSDFSRLLNLIFRNIWIFIVFGALAIAVAFLYNSIAPKSYKVTSSVLINRDVRTPIGGLGGLSGLFGGSNNIQNELFVIKSSPIIERAVRNLNLEVSYFKTRFGQQQELYNKSPFQVIIFKDHPQVIGAEYKLHFQADGSFELSAKSERATLYDYETETRLGYKDNWEFKTKAKPGDVIETDDLKFVVELNKGYNLFENNNTKFVCKFSTIDVLRNAYEKQIQFSMVHALGTVIELSLVSGSAQKAKDILNEVVNVYMQQNLEKKNHIANMTIAYIESQLEEVSQSLNIAGDSLQRFRAENQLVDITRQGTDLSIKLSELQSRLAELVTQKRYYEHVTQYLTGRTGEEQIIAPASMGVQDPLLNKLIEELSTAQSQRSNLINNNQQRNPMVERLGVQIDNLKRSVAENISSALQNNEISSNEVKKQIYLLERDISKLPKTQMKLGDFERKYQLNDAIYNFLLEKHADAKITKASNLPDFSVVEPAEMVGLTPVSPNKTYNFVLAILLAIALPFGFILLKQALKDKIETVEDLQKVTNAPLLGKILHFRTKRVANVFHKAPRSKTAESFRAMRTNLNFHMNGEPQKTILVTSSLSGEGKTFCALNMAAAYAAMNKKTLLVDFDLRTPNTIMPNIPNGEGLSNYLSGKVDLNDLIKQTEIDNLSIITSGPIPPNPNELMESEKLSALFKHLKKTYDYIILDSAPLGQVTDAYPLTAFSTVNLLTTRYNTTSKKLLKVVLENLKQKGIQNVALILNDNKLGKEQVGYGYGYDGKKQF